LFSPPTHYNKSYFVVVIKFKFRTLKMAIVAWIYLSEIVILRCNDVGKLCQCQPGAI